MSTSYRAVGWNRHKRLYDLAVGFALLLALAVYGITIATFRPGTTIETFVIRFTSIAALVLLHVVLAIGPLARLDRRFLPLLYNRRHLGVTMFLFSLIHGVFAIIQFHGGGNLNPLVSVLTAYRREYLAILSAPTEVAHFPFEAFGLVALLIFFVMAATSHDFWLRNLGPSFWKIMHMFVYLAYALVIAHVFLGALQSERSPVFPVLLGLGFAGLITVHLAAFAKELKSRRTNRTRSGDGFLFAGHRADLVPGAGRVIAAGSKRIALFVHEGKLFALSNVCRHQGGPLGEGRMVAGCLTCPWHGYQYRIEDGCSPPPFTEVVPTHEVRVAGEELYVSKQPLPLGTRSAGIPLGGSEKLREDSEFYIGWQARGPVRLARHTRQVFFAGLAASSAVFFLAGRFQNRIDAGAFEFGVSRIFEGTVMEFPLPLLHVQGPRDQPGMNFLLVGSGKFGASEIVRGQDGRHVRLQGSLLHRHGVAMIELNQPDSLHVLGSPLAAPPPVISLGSFTLVGELVDSKCFLGAMRPATGKVHRGCAVRCLSGGAPPALLVRDEQGRATAILLAASNDKPLNIDPALAARTLEVHGDLEFHRGLPILRVHSWRLAD